MANSCARIESLEELDEVMTRPGDRLCEFVKTLESPLLILGAAGKMGPSLAVQVNRAAQVAGHKLEVVAASRFSDSKVQIWLRDRGIKTVSCDLLEREALTQLPDSPNVIHLVGMKFGTAQNPSLTWAVNTLVPTHVSERYPHSRIAALSTGNVYPMVSIDSGGSTEESSTTPVGEYANAAVARERLFEYHSRRSRTPMVLLRLNYAVDLRYGVLLEIAQAVWAEKPVDVTTGYFNCIWQGDANECVVRSLDLASSPPAVLNLTGSETLSVSEIAGRIGRLMGRSVTLVGQEAQTALLSNSSRLFQRLGTPAASLDRILEWTANWVMRGGSTYGKATHFQVRDGKY